MIVKVDHSDEMHPRTLDDCVRGFSLLPRVCVCMCLERKEFGNVLMSRRMIEVFSLLESSIWIILSLGIRKYS